MAKFETQDKALALLSQIQDYWKARGYVIQGYVSEGGYSPRLRSTVYEIHTDLVNGVPRQLAKAA